MARKTFIAYKYSEAKTLRDRIIDKLGDDAKYYQGERAESPDLTDTSTENIKDHLKDMLFDTSVTIVIISPKLKRSKWIDWEIEYSMREYDRKGIKSRTNGIVGVVMKVNGDYDWLIITGQSSDGCNVRYFRTNLLYDIINNNRFNNLTDDKYACNVCCTYDSLKGSYISLINEDDFLRDPSYYIDNAFDKREKLVDFKLCKSR